VFSKKLLAWYDKSQRTLPWRKEKTSPYHTWLSEIMLQQTTVATVIPRFQSFLIKWPTIEDLARASLDEVLTEWQGLGYYSRARNLHRCAQILAQEFPSTEEGLLALPGIGPYTAAAIASIAFNQKAAAVDGNVIRVLSRYFAINNLKPAAIVKKKLYTLLPNERHGDFTQALIELGALVCRPKKPACATCPLKKDCQAYALEIPEEYPIKVNKKKIPTRYATAFILKREDGAILLRKRPPQGLLGGMMEVPTSDWIEMKEKKKSKEPIVRHTFTHFHLEIEVCYEVDPSSLSGVWVMPEDLKNYALPTVMKKILKVVI